METAKIDLHIHSAYSSDGEIDPAELVRRAKHAGLAAIAIADHNTTAATISALREGEAAGLRVLSAVELSCEFEGIEFHLLGYGINPNDAALAGIDSDVRRQEQTAGKERIRLVNAAGIAVNEAEVLPKARHGVFVTGELLAEIVLNKPDAAQNPLLRPYLPGGTRSDNPYVNFYWDICAQGKPAYVPVDFISMARAVELVHAAGGVAVLAHPGQNLGSRREMLADIARLGVDGMECYSSYHSPEDNRYFSEKTQELGLLITGGSDWHGKTKPAIQMGQFGLAESGLELLAALDEAIERQRENRA